MKKLSLILLSSLFILSCDSLSPDGGNSPNNGNSGGGVFRLESSSFTSGGTIPSRFTNHFQQQCSGNNDFPALSWSNAPVGTQSFVLIVDDPDGNNWVHLNLYDISATTTSISELTATAGVPFPVVTFPGGTVGQNSWGSSGWGGPCPPGGTHEYFFKLYALSVANLGGPLNQVTRTSFETTHMANILGSVSISGFVSR